MPDEDDLIMGQELDSIDLTPEKYDISISIVVVNGVVQWQEMSGIKEGHFEICHYRISL